MLPGASLLPAEPGPPAGVCFSPGSGNLGTTPEVLGQGVCPFPLLLEAFLTPFPCPLAPRPPALLQSLVPVCVCDPTLSRLSRLPGCVAPSPGGPGLGLLCMPVISFGSKHQRMG